MIAVKIQWENPGVFVVYVDDRAVRTIEEREMKRVKKGEAIHIYAEPSKET